MRDAAKTLLSIEQVGAFCAYLRFSGEIDALQWQITLLCSLSAAINNGFLFLQVRETIEWLSTSFCKLRLSSVDFRTFGLFSKWTPYVAEVKTFLEYLIKQLIDTEVANLAQEPVGSSRILAGNVSLNYLIALIPSVKGHLNIQ